VGREAVVMLTSSYPRFPGDGIGTFVEPIAHGVAALGREVHVVAPWHPLVQRPAREGNVHFHFFRYAPLPGLHAFGYATALKADVALRPTAYLAAPLAMAAGWKTVRAVVRQTGASILHAHWVVPGGVIAALSRTRIPLVISLHGSDVFLAESNRIVRTAARLAFRRAGWITACSEDLRRRAVALGADTRRTEVVPYGVDTERFRPDAAARSRVRREHDIPADTPVLVTVGRLVRKKGFAYLIDALVDLKNRWPRVKLFVIGQGDLESDLRQRAASNAVGDHVVFLGALRQDQVADWLAAADVAIVPSVLDASGNVDGLPNVVLESLSSGTPVVATGAGGIGSVAVDRQTARVVPERDPSALASAIGELLAQPEMARALGRAAREEMSRGHAWSTVAERFTAAYDRASRVG
jgi:glycosyltransferase involved in cell wall biosynthesis